MSSHVIEKLKSIRDRLVHKIGISKTPVKGFVVGMSGTDSVITLILLDAVRRETNIHVVGINYVSDARGNVFGKNVLPWLRAIFPEVHVGQAMMANMTDAQRWAKLHDRAVRDPDNRLWVASTVNATEKALGTYSILAKSASIEPIASLWKSEVIELCREYNVPNELLIASQVPDCACGRDEFAAENIQLIDDVLRNSVNCVNYDKDDIVRAMTYISATRSEQDFKNRTPYSV